MLLEPPHLALGTAAELGRVKQYTVVAAAAADLARGELGCVVDDPADRPLGEARQRGVGAAALDRLLRCVDMDEAPAGLAQQQRADPGVAEQVEDLGVVRAGLHPVPLRRHVGEESEVAEGGEGRVEAHVAAYQRPAGGDGTMLDPAPAALLVRAGNEGRVGVPVGCRRGPHRLRFGADDADRSIALIFAAVTAVDQPEVGPRLGDDRVE